MAGSVVVSLREALVTGLSATVGLTDVQVTYGWPGDDRLQRERIFFSRASGTQTPASLRNGRTYRAEEGELEIVIQVEKIGGSMQDADDRAIALGQLVEEYVADNRTGLAVTGLNWIQMSGWELHNLYNDRGSLSEVTYTLHYSARLT